MVHTNNISFVKEFFYKSGAIAKPVYVLRKNKIK